MKAITYKGVYSPIVKNNGIAITIIVAQGDAKGSTQIVNYKEFSSRQQKMLKRNVTHTDYKEVKNLMTGTIVKIPVDTPHSCDPSGELYWTM
jgi:5-bromo-4-chloroindolyl phosphate hydrolysis protein